MEKVTLTPLVRCLTALLVWTMVLCNASTLSKSLSPFGCALVAALLLWGTYVFLRGQKLPPAAMVVLLLLGSGCSSSSKEPVRETRRELCRQPFQTWAQVCHVDNGRPTWYSGRDLTLIQWEQTGYYWSGAVWYCDTFWMVKTKDTLLFLDNFYSASDAPKVMDIQAQYQAIAKQQYELQAQHIHAPQ